MVPVNSRPTHASDTGETSNVDGASESAAAALPMSIAEETEAAILAITGSENERPMVTCSESEARRASSSGSISRRSSECDAPDRVTGNEDGLDSDNSTIAERLRQARRTSAEAQQHLVSRSRQSKDYVRGLTGNPLYKCGVAGAY